MKKILLLFILFISYYSYSQTEVDTLWTKTIGGSFNDPPNSFPRANPKIDISSDGDIYMVSSTESDDKWVNNNIGSYDCWLVKMNSGGDTLWTKVFGGTSLDLAKSIVALNDGGCAVTGFTYSNDFDFTGNHDSNELYQDGFITRFDAEGNISWTKLYGGANVAGIGGTDFFNKIIVNNSGNFVVAGQTNSFNGDLTLDFDKFYVGWVLEVNPENGNIITNKKVAGFVHDENHSNELTDICKLSDGTGYMAFGAQTYFVSDHFWLVKLDMNADTVYTREYDCGNFNRSIAITEADDGGFIFTGTINNGGGDVETYIGGYDIWVVKIDDNGEIIDQATYGGTSHEVSYSIKPDNNGNWLITAQTRSYDLFAPEGYGETDFLLINFDSNLDTIYTHRMGGTGFESLTDVVVSNSGDNVFVVGRTNSNDIFIHNNNGEFDIWFADLIPKLSNISELKEKNGDLYCSPNPANANFYIKNLEQGVYKIKIYDIMGKLIYKNDKFGYDSKINITKQGIYLISFGNDILNNLKVIIQ